MMHTCSFYLLTDTPNAELTEMYNLFPNAAIYPDQNIVIFAETHPAVFEPVNATLLIDEENGSTAIHQLISLIRNHTTQNAVLISLMQVRAIHGILNATGEPV